MTVFADQTGRQVCVQHTPMRIVSLVPSLTELLYQLGADERVAGITKFCVHPADWFRTKTRIGGTKNVHIDQVRSLSPDLVIASKEENIREQVEAIAGFAPVWVSDITCLEEALAAIRTIGRLIETPAAADELAAEIAQRFATLYPVTEPLKTAYLIWKDPYMTVGHDTFIHDMLQRCGLENVYGDKKRYPAIPGIQELAQLGCQLVLLSSEPYPFNTSHARILQQQLPQARILLADGEYFSWYGSRLLGTPAYFSQLFQSLSH